MASKLMPYQVTVHGVSDVGLVRSNNEDAWRQEDLFCVLADGMGGHQAGEIASKKTVDYLSEFYLKVRDSFSDDPDKARQILQKMIEEVNRYIYDLSQTEADWKGMGTTLCCLLLQPETLIYAHVGDSRIYRLRNNSLEQLTHDHSLLRELIDLGRLNERQAKEFSYKNIITRAIGTSPVVKPSISQTSLLPEDLILMCTDGLSDLLSEEEIKKICDESSESEMGKNLVARAKEKGGYDNITVVVLKVHPS